MSKQGRGLNFNYHLSYDTPVWYVHEVGTVKTWSPDASAGWNLGVTNVTTPTLLYALGSDSHAVVTHQQICTGYSSYYENYAYTDPDNVSHLFGTGTVWPYNTCGLSMILDETATDGSGLKLHVDNTVQLSPVETVTYPDGTVFDAIHKTLTDSNGNYIAVSTDGTYVTDTFGVTVLSVSGSGTPTSPVIYTYQGPAGAKTVTVNYEALSAGTDFLCSGINEGGLVANVPSSIVYADGSSYQFAYDSHNGTMTSMTVPTGGVVTFAYSGSHNGVDCPAGGGSGTYQSSSWLHLVETRDGGNWTWDRSASLLSTVTRSDPASNNVVGVFNGVFDSITPEPSYPTQFKSYSGSSTLLKTIDIAYTGTDPNKLNNIVTTTTLGGGQVNTKTTLFTLNGALPTETDQTDWGTGGAGSLLRKVSITYASLGNNISNRPSLIVGGDGTTTFSQTSYTYDSGGVITTTGTPNHASITGSRGNPTTVSRWVSGTTWLSRSATFYDTGLESVVTDVNGATTTYDQSACNNSATASITNNPVSLGVTLAYSYSCAGGLQPSGQTDPNGNSTSFGFNDDNFWRQTDSTDELGYDTKTSYLYNGTTPIGMETSLTFNGTSSINDHRMAYDSYGRDQVSQIEKGPSSSQYDSQWTRYDTFGRQNLTSIPYQGTAGQLGGTVGTTTTYDALSRVTSITGPDGGNQTYCYTPSANAGCTGGQSNDVLVTTGPAPSGENAKRVQYEYDALGRLTSVCEITSANGAGPCGQHVAQTGFLTSYIYDTRGGLVSIAQGLQTRTFTYDGLGRRLTENNPESGLTKFFYDTAPSSPGVACPNPTFTGDLVKIYDANGNTNCREYDSLHRITAMKYSGPNSGVTPQRHFVYDAATITVNGTSTTMQNAKGRLAEAYTGTSSSKITDMGFSYTERGELTTLYEKTPHSGTTSAPYYVLTAQYYENGALSEFDAGTSITGLPPYVLTPNGQGQLTGVTTSDPLNNNPVLLTNALYDNAGHATEVDFGSGDKDTFLFDSNFLRWEKGTYTMGNAHDIVVDPTWNTDGSLQKLVITDPNNSTNAQTCQTYTSDDLGRLTNVDCTATKWQQTFSYD